MRQFALITLMVLSFVNAIAYIPPNHSRPSGEVLFNSLTLGKTKQTIIMRYRPETGETALFSDLEYATVIGVSPNNKIVAVQRFTNPNLGEQQLCFLNRDGGLQICANDSFATYADASTGHPFVSWSSDSAYLYYVNYISGQETTERRLVEIEVATGRMKRIVVILRANFGYLHDFMWTPDLSLIGVLWDRAAYDLVGGARLYKISNGQAQPDRDLTQIISSKTQTSPLNQPEKLTHYLVPCRFSSKGSYIAFIDQQAPMNIEPPLKFVVQDQAGKTVYQTTDSTMPRSCPTWQEDESAFFYATFTEKRDSNSGQLKQVYRLHKVTMPEGKISAISAPEDLSFAKFDEPYLYPRPDGRFLAFQGSYNPEAEGITGIGTNISTIGIVGADGKVSYIKGPFHNAYNPVWLPSAN